MVWNSATTSSRAEFIRLRQREGSEREIGAEGPASHTAAPGVAHPDPGEIHAQEGDGLSQPDGYAEFVQQAHFGFARAQLVDIPLGKKVLHKVIDACVDCPIRQYQGCGPAEVDAALQQPEAGAVVGVLRVQCGWRGSWNSNPGSAVSVTRSSSSR